MESKLLHSNSLFLIQVYLQKVNEQKNFNCNERVRIILTIEIKHNDKITAVILMAYRSTNLNLICKVKKIISFYKILFRN